MIVEFKSGNFKLTVNGELNDDSKAKMLENGMRYAIQRDVATAVYLALAGEKGENGKAKLPEGFERDSVAWSEENGLAFQDAAEKALASLGTFEVSIGENVGGEGSAMKRATELVDTFIGTDVEKSYRLILGLPDGTRDELIKAAHARGLGITPARKAKA